MPNSDIQSKRDFTLVPDEHRYWMMLDNMLEGCQVLGRDWTYLYINPVAAAQGRRSVDELLGSDIRDMYPGIEETNLFTVLTNCMENQVTDRITNEFRYDNGDVAWFNLSIHPIPEGIFVLSLDVTEQVLSDQALKESETRYRRIVETAQEGIFTTDHNEVITFLNQKFAEMLGYTQEEISGKSFREFVDEDVDDIIPQDPLNWGERVREKIEIRFRKKTGDKIIGLTSISPLFDSENQFIGILAMVSDITGRKKSETLQAKLAAIVNSSNDAIIGKDMDAMITSWNDGATRMYGYTAEEAIGEPIYLIVPPERTDEIEGIMEGLKSGKQIRHYETQRVRKDGQLIDVSLTVSPIKNAAGDIVGASAIARDISMEKETQRDLLNALERERIAHEQAEKNKERYLFLAESSRTLASSLDFQSTLQTVAQQAVPAIADWCAVDILDESGHLQRVAVVHSDPAKVELAEELRSKFSFVNGRNTNESIRTGTAVLYSSITDDIIEQQVVNPELKTLLKKLGLHSVIVVPLTARDKTFGSITLVSSESGRTFKQPDLRLAESLAERAATAVDNARLYHEANQAKAELEQRVNRRTEELRKSNEELEAFSYSVSHDLRAPLRAVDGFSRIVQEEYSEHLPDEGQRYLNLIRQNSQQMGRLIDDLLTLSRLSRYTPEFEKVDMKMLVKEVVSELKPEFPNPAAKIRIRSLPVAYGDPHLLHQVWVNLLMNALKYSKNVQKPLVEIVGKNENSSGTYIIHDNGIGFDMKYAHKLFEVFQRLHKAEDYEGTGIGLAIVKRIITHHRGEVWAESTPGEGATFYFTLPQEDIHDKTD